jgi:integrase/recombinase XerD
MTRSGFEYILDKQVQIAAKSCPSLSTKRVSPHVLRHYLPFLTMSSDIGQVSLSLGRYRSRRGRDGRIARHSLFDSTGC